MSQHVLFGISTGYHGYQMVRIVNGQVVNSAALQKRLRYHCGNLVYQQVQTCGKLDPSGSFAVQGQRAT